MAANHANEFEYLRGEKLNYKVFSAARLGNAVVLTEALQQMNSSERACVLETRRSYQTPLIVSVKNGHLDCVKVLLNYKADIEGRCSYREERYHTYTACTPLFIAAACGNLDVLSCLVENGADVNACTNDNCTPLMIASGKGYVNVATFLVEHGANVDLRDAYGNGKTALHYAVEHWHDSCDILSCLIKNGAHANACTNDKCTPLMIASRKGDVNAVTFLVEHGDVDLEDDYGKTALHYAVDNVCDSCDVLSCLIENGADVNARMNDNCTPLTIASRNGDVNAVTFLIKHGANVDLQDEDGKTSLCHAVEHYCHGNLCVLSCLVENGADVNAYTNVNCTPLMIAIRKGYVKVATFLIEHGANLNLQDKDGKTALHYAVKHYCHGNLCVLSCLVENGADVNAHTNDNCTPLMIAIRKGYVNVATFLIGHGGNVNLQYKDGKTALHYAVKHCCDNLRVLSCLVENGADVNAHTNDNCTTLMIASKKGKLDVVNFLIKHGANVDLQDKDGKTALHHAVDHNFVIGVLSCLIENGADVNAHTNDEGTTLTIAVKKNNVNAVTFLVEHGANVDLQDKDGKTALHHAVEHRRNSEKKTFDVLRLITKGTNVNVHTNDGLTPLIFAIINHNLNQVTFLVENGANIDLQDENGETALHYAVHGNSSELVLGLLTLGASQLYNNQGLTPLLSASAWGKVSLVKEMISRPNCTKKQRIDALELLGAYFATTDRKYTSTHLLQPRSFFYFLVEKEPFRQNVAVGFKYLKRGMKERFQDSSHPLQKEPVELVEAYQFRKESQTLEELALIEGDTDAIIMEGLIIRERILGTDNLELLSAIRCVAGYLENRDLPTCIELYRHAIKIAQRCNESAISDLNKLICLLFEKIWMNDPPREEDLLELLEQTVLEYESAGCKIFLDSSTKLVQIIVKCKYFEDGKTSCVPVLLRRLLSLNLRGNRGDTLLHDAVNRGCIDTVKLLLNAGSNVNAVNDNGDTPLHIAVTRIHMYSSVDNSMLGVLLDGGAHHDFVNNRWKTAMDMAVTDEARMILCEKRKLELKCISARAVKKFGLPYLGVVPKILEKYISRH